MNLVGAEYEYFRKLVKFCQAKTNVAKKIVYEEMTEIAKAQKVRILEGESFSFYESWIYPILRELAPMIKILLSITAMVFVFEACSNENGVSTSTKSNNSSAAPSNADYNFMKTLLGELGNVQAISDDVILDEATPTEGGTLSASPAAINPFKTKPEITFSDLRSTGCCWVNVYKEENGIYYSKSVIGKNSGTDSDDSYIILAENDGSVYKFETHLKTYSENAVSQCSADSSAFAAECDRNKGLSKIYNKGCSAASFEASCVTKVFSDSTLESIADVLKSECETFVAKFLE